MNPDMSLASGPRNTCAATAMAARTNLPAATSARSIAFPPSRKSGHADDWRELMRLFMVRRTRSFVERNYAFTECPECATVLYAHPGEMRQVRASQGQGGSPFPRFLRAAAGSTSPSAGPRPSHFAFATTTRMTNTPGSIPIRWWTPSVVLHLPRYGLANYLKPTLDVPPSQDEAEVMDNLSRAGKRLIGFCRTNLFKRLESSGHSFLLSVRRHILRNYIYLHALENKLPLPDRHAGLRPVRHPQPRITTATAPCSARTRPRHQANGNHRQDPCRFRHRPEAAGYQTLTHRAPRNFDWLRPDVFVEDLAQHLQQDANGCSPSSNSRANGCPTRITNSPSFTNS